MANGCPITSMWRESWWVKTRRVEKAKRVLKVSELNKEKKIVDYQERNADEWNEMM